MCDSREPAASALILAELLPQRTQRNTENKPASYDKVVVAARAGASIQKKDSPLCFSVPSVVDVLAFLPLVNFSYGIERADLIRVLVGTDAQNARKAQSKAAGVAIRAHHVVECYFQHDLGFHGAAEALVVDGMLQKPLCHLGDFGVGQAGIGFTHVEQLVSIADGEGVIAEHAGALAVSPLDSGDDNIKSGQLAFQLQP